MRPLAVALLLLLAADAPAQAGSATTTLQITIQSPLAIAFSPTNPTIACNAAAGSVVSAMSVTGGDGNPATFSATGGDTSDFAVNGVDVVVGTNGIAAANCGKTMTLTITANQP